MFCFEARNKSHSVWQSLTWLNNTLVTGQKFFSVVLLATKKANSMLCTSVLIICVENQSV